MPLLVRFHESLLLVGFLDEEEVVIEFPGVYCGGGEKVFLLDSMSTHCHLF